eukprot:TRINITY_DN37740_c0_g1_i1.p1 TRINITY_DN37740_c0_g1~~TRINITY_DN37740_c0_g1_i1.p1  ORF type:complete len:115 (-),score=25.11 TRINITY_DN37740_c0_g1_i1:28-372(-)
MIRRPPRSTLSSSSAASDVYKRQVLDTFTSMYIEYEHIRGFPNPQFSFRRVSKEHYKQGAFLSDGTISFLTQFNPVVQMMFSDDMNSDAITNPCLLYTSPSPRDRTRSRMPSSA